MPKYVYPAVFHHNADDNSYTVIFNDLPGCITEGKTLNDALFMAEDALALWLECATAPLPTSSNPATIPLNSGEFVSLVSADIKDTRAVRRTVSLPKWLDDQAATAGLSLSRVLQDAIKDRLHI